MLFYSEQVLISSCLSSLYNPITQDHSTNGAHFVVNTEDTNWSYWGFFADPNPRTVLNLLVNRRVSFLFLARVARRQDVFSISPPSENKQANCGGKRIIRQMGIVEQIPR